MKNPALLLVLAAGLAAPTLQARPEVPGAIASWDFEPGHGDTLWDGTGNGHHGVIHGALWSDGMHGKALRFGGMDWVEIPAHPALEVRSFTFSLWLYQSGNSFRFPLFEWQLPNTPVGVLLTANTSGYAQDLPGALCANLRPHDASASQPSSVRERNFFYTAAGTALGGRWNHVVLSYDSATSKARIHVNGRLRMAKTLEPFRPRTVGSIILGRRLPESIEWDAGSGLVGSLDQAALYGRALGESEIATLYGLTPVDPLSIHLGMATHYAKAGDTVTVPLWISSDGKDSLSSLGMSLAYDTTVALLVGAALDTATVPGWAFASPVPAGRSPADLSASGSRIFSGARDAVYLRLRFRLRPEARNGASTMLSLSGIAVDGGRQAAITHAPGRLFVLGPDIRYGDVNRDGLVDLVDAAAILAFSVGHRPPPAEYPDLALPVADVSGNGSITAYDAALVLQHALGMLEEFPIQSRPLAKRGAAATLAISAPIPLGGNLYRYRLQGAGLEGLVGGEARLAADPAVLRIARIAGGLPGIRTEERFDPASGRLDLAFSGNRKSAAGEVTLLELDVEQTDAQSRLRLESAYLDEGRIEASGVPSRPTGIRPAPRKPAPAGYGRGGLWDIKGRRLPAGPLRN